MIDTETCEAWLRAQLSRARWQSVTRLIATACATLLVFILQFMALAITVHYFAALALVRLLHLPPEDPVNRTVLAVAHWGWSIEECASAAMALFVMLYIALRRRGGRELPALAHTEDTGEPAMTFPQASRTPVRSDLTRAVPNAFDHVRAIVFALPRLIAAALAEIALLWRLHRISTGPCAAVVANLFGRGEVKLSELEQLVGPAVLAEALPHLWEFPGIQFHSGEKDALSLGPVAADQLLSCGVA
ncbi:MAG: hypothetical protein H6839_01395 [Planctomycetes bacterium]|nr:hypothetical protein [Planctomycetota bacterium]